MIRIQNIFTGTVVLVFCLTVSGCAAANKPRGPYASFTGADLVNWGASAAVTPCDELSRQYRTTKAIKSNRYKLKGGSTQMLKVFSANTAVLLEAQGDRCPQIRSSAGKRLMRAFTG